MDSWKRRCILGQVENLDKLISSTSHETAREGICKRSYAPPTDLAENVSLG
jgi:hypothetical protein